MNQSGIQSVTWELYMCVYVFPRLLLSFSMEGLVDFIAHQMHLRIRQTVCCESRADDRHTGCLFPPMPRLSCPVGS